MKIEKILSKYYSMNDVQNIKELEGGMCNKVYRAKILGNDVVIKLFDNEYEYYMSHEKHLMKNEIESLIKAASYEIAVPNMIFAEYLEDTGVSFFIESYVEGENLQSYIVRGGEEVDRLLYNAGKYVREINSYEGEYFGTIAGGDKYNSWKECFGNMIRMVINDAKAKNVDITVPYERVLTEYEKQSDIFDKVSRKSFLHGDCWNGNFFVKDGKIVCLIDWERALYGDYLFEDIFRHHSRNEELLRGYGKIDFTDEERHRMYWYDAYLYMTMMTEGRYRNYMDDSQYNWVKSLFLEIRDNIL